MVDFKKLSAPFDPKLVSWRVGQVTKANNRKASALCYIDARDVMERLDEVCGPDGWEDSYVETAKGRVVCTIRIRVEKGDNGNPAQAMQNGYGVRADKWISKSDGAGDTAVEGEKGGISDAFKRAAVKWGIGRYLYDIPKQWVAVDEYKQIEKSEYAKLAAALPGSRVASCDEPDETPVTSPPPPPPPPPVDPEEQRYRDRVKSITRAIDACGSLSAVNTLMVNYGWNATSKVADPDTALAEIRARNIETYDFLLRRAEDRRNFFASHPDDKKAA